MKRLVLLALTCCFTCVVNAQTENETVVEQPKRLTKDLSYSSNWYLHPNFGVFTNLQKLDKGVSTDVLVKMPKDGIYTSLISVSHFPRFIGGKWGVEFNLVTTFPFQDNDDIILGDTLVSTFDSRFELTERDSLVDFNYNSMLRRRTQIGINFRYLKGRWLLMSRLLYSTSSLSSRDYRGVWKETGTNNYYRYSTTSSLPSTAVKGFTGGLTAGYAISHQTIFTLSANYSRFNARVAYKEELYNLYTEEFQVNRVDYSRVLSSFTFGFGFIFEV